MGGLRWKAGVEHVLKEVLKQAGEIRRRRRTNPDIGLTKGSADWSEYFYHSPPPKGDRSEGSILASFGQEIGPGSITIGRRKFPGAFLDHYRPKLSIGTPFCGD